MNDLQKNFIWISAAVGSVAGIVLLIRENAAGWFLMLLGGLDIAVLTRRGQMLSTSRPVLVRWGLIAAHGLLIALTVWLGLVKR